jgi:hypothetical protein
MASISAVLLGREELANFFPFSLRVHLPCSHAFFDLIPPLRELLAKLGLAKGAAAKKSKDASGSEVLLLLFMALSLS